MGVVGARSVPASRRSRPRLGPWLKEALDRSRVPVPDGSAILRLKIFLSCVTRMLVRWQRWGVSVVSLEDAYERYADDLVRYATLLAPICGRRCRCRHLRRSAAQRRRCLVHRPASEGVPVRCGGEPGTHAPPTEHATPPTRATTGPHDTSFSRGRCRRFIERVAGGARRIECAAACGDLPHLLAGFLGAQVAEALGVSDGTVRRQLARARSRLRGALS